MAFANPSASRPQGPRPPRPSGGGARRRRNPLVITALVLVAIVLVVILLAQFWTEVMWFDQLGFSTVLWTEWGTRAALFAAGFLVMGGAVFAALTVAYKSRPIYAPSNREQVSLDAYREAIEPLRKVVVIAAPAVLGLFAGVAASQQWSTVQLWLNSTPVGTDDPQYGIDLGFYLFQLPGIRFVVSFVMAVVVLSGIAALVTQYLYGGLRIGPANGTPRMTKAARVQLSVIAAVLMLLIAANYWLDQYSVLTSQGDRFEGASYTDVNAVIPSKQILAAVAVLVALMFVFTAVRGTWRVPALGVGLMVVGAVAIGGIYPAVVQRFQVNPNQQESEAPYIQRNIDATLAAYNLEDVEVSSYNAKTDATPGALREDAETTASIRLLDPQEVSPSFRQLEQIRGFYSFADTLSVDRYEIDGESRDTVIAVREIDLDGLDANRRNWNSDATIYTHGYGVVAAYGNTTTSTGAPDFWEAGIPSTGELGEYEPRIYFGQNSPEYSIVGAPEGEDSWEFDYPSDDAENGAVTTTFPTNEVSAGPEISNLWTKLLYSIKFGSEQILFSDRVNSESQILYDRDPVERVQKVAPYLTLDGRVYPAVVDGRVVWMVDGYTTSDQYPYAARQSLEDATTDSLTETSRTVQALEPRTVNYIRNSVKATVDAYDGTVTLYAWDTEDPVLQTWAKVFDNTLTPASEISSDLMSHIRYPEDLFKVQRTLLGQYHVTDPNTFFTGSDFWRTPNDPTAGESAGVAQPPYYLTLQMPGQDQASFSLMSTYIPSGGNARDVLTGYIAVDAEAGSEAGNPAEGYGKIRLLELPRDSTIPGPNQMNNNFSSTPAVSNELNILERGGSSVIRGNLLTLPVGGGLLYVQPVYVQASSGTQVPLLQRVLVAFGDEIGFASTLDEALDQVFGGDSGTQAGDAGNEIVEPDTGGDTDGDTGGTPDPDATDTPEPDATESPSGDATTRRTDALNRAQQALQDGQEALANNDFAAYGEAQDRLQQALEDAIAADTESGSGG
ncbi:UPF0182 family protein [Cellulomonas denverensis]|uniref:UPF0182 protein HGA03_06950 n=1 Tax=Cellulomonas denverensis TaxID=264297 RepID=A0A7X6QYQ4_9CELL|nr:UPF0182 family protein [Cellulomonas denverensis]NKY22404.1 UPF0182 family protein [Cellulomonas denverensis]GIG26329.1 UPF0182 protein [Cellulomonas denverensis]